MKVSRQHDGSIRRFPFLSQRFSQSRACLNGPESRFPIPSQQIARKARSNVGSDRGFAILSQQIALRGDSNVGPDRGFAILSQRKVPPCASVPAFPLAAAEESRRACKISLRCRSAGVVAFPVAARGEEPPAPLGGRTGRKGEPSRRENHARRPSYGRICDLAYSGCRRKLLLPSGITA